MSDDSYSEPSVEMSGEKKGKGDAYDYFLKKKKEEAGEDDDSDDGAPISDSDDEDFTPLEDLKKEMTEKAPAQPIMAMDDEDDMELS
jgi:hypothetical protein